MPGIGVINNPRSRQNRKNPDRINTLGYILGKRGQNVTTPDLQTLAEVAEEFKKNEIDILAINGGDGSNHVTLTTFIETYGDKPLPTVALMRGGTYNTISNALGIKGTPESIMFNLVDKYHNGLPFETVDVNLLNVMGRYGFIFGNGVVGNFMDSYYEGGPPTVASGAKVFFNGVKSGLTGGELHRKWFKQITGEVIVDGVPLPRKEFFALICMTIKEIGLGFKPAYRANDEPDTMHFIGIFCTAGELIKELPRMRLGRPWHPEKAFDMLAKEVTFNLTEPFSYTIDGDMHRHEEGLFTIKVGPRLKVIRG